MDKLDHSCAAYGEESSIRACASDGTAMFDNNTSILNSTGTNTTSTNGAHAKRCILYAVVTLSSITFIIGVTSWTLIKKFRHFKNYIFLSIIFNNIVNLVMTDLIKDISKSDSVEIKIAGGTLFLYFRMSAHCWLSVLCWVFYVDLVKVFSGEVTKKYLKISLFAWGVPTIIIVFCSVVVPNIDETGDTSAILFNSTLFLPLLVNILIYVKVLLALFNNVNDSSDRWRRVQVATAIFLVSGCLFLLLPFRLLNEYPRVVTSILIYLPHIAMDVYFFVVRLNRDVWKKYYECQIKGGSRQDLC